MDIVDPHRHDANDAAPKWAALAEYAQEHSDRVRRCVAVVRDQHGDLRALDLTVEGIEQKIAAATNKDLMETLPTSEEYGFYAGPTHARSLLTTRPRSSAQQVLHPDGAPRPRPRRRCGPWGAGARPAP